MAGIGIDIKDVLEELGTSLTIYKWPGPTTILESIDHEFYATHSSEFLRMFFSGVTLTYDTQVLPGDVVEAMGYWFICTANFPSYFENEIVDYTAVFYRCNVFGTLQRYNPNAGWDANYNKLTNWSPVQTGVRAVQYENRFDQKQYIAEDVMALTMEGNLLFLPSYVSPIEGDRWIPDAADVNTFFRVGAIDTLRLDNVSICTLKDDERE